MGGAVPAPGTGTSRGRGDAELTFGDESPEHAGKFELEVLPAAKRRDAEHTRLFGVGTTSPTVDPRGEVGTGAGGGPAGGGTAWDRRLAPHHRRAVRNFFGGGTGARD